MKELALLEFVHKLKSLKRKGWLMHGITDAESVADHSYSVSVLVMAMAKKLRLDEKRCMEIALIHDLAESLTTDITPHDSNYKDKKELEDRAVEKICGATGYSFMDLWKEYSEHKTDESRLVHDMDLIDMAAQALAYENKTGRNLEEFFLHVKDKLYFEESRLMFGHIHRKRSSE
jgi:putative hydrolases of HD superfamily